MNTDGMAELEINRRHALYVAGALLMAGCSSEPDRSDAVSDTKTDSDVNTATAAWRRIHNWLFINAPKIVGNLNSPATDSEILEGEKEFGFQMPLEWREIYRVHNGMNSNANLGSLFYGMQFLSLERAINDHKNNSVPVEDAHSVRVGDPAIRKQDIYKSKWIALAHHGAETLIRVDMDPSPSGNAGQVIFTDHAHGTVILLSKSIADFMSCFAHDLEAGRYFLDKDALAEGNQFLNCDSEIDVINWAHSRRWKHLAQ